MLWGADASHRNCKSCSITEQNDDTGGHAQQAQQDQALLTCGSAMPLDGPCLDGVNCWVVSKAVRAFLKGGVREL